jgi:Zn-dependent protease with chaperone function
MIVAVLLIGYAALLGAVGPRVLQIGTWTDRSPRLAIICWQALSLSVLASVTLAGLALAAPAAPFSTNLAAVLRACLIAFKNGHATAAGVGTILGGLVLATAVVARSLGCLAAGLIRSARERSRHVRALSLITRNCEHSGTLILNHATPAAYCLPGRYRRVVLTSAALEALDSYQLQAVLAHERAHLSGRHHLVLEAAAALKRAFPRVSLFAQAHGEITRLVELVADDVAARRYGRLPVATAMVTMSRGDAPSMALAAGGAGALERVRRLLEPARPLRPKTVLAGFALASAVIVIPAIAAVTPALSAARMSACPMVAAASPSATTSTCHSSGAHDIARLTTA